MDVLKLSKYQEKSYEETPSKSGWVTYGEDNLYPQYLIDLYHSSATHNALCNSIAYMIFGDGLQSDDLETKLAFEKWNLDDHLRRACLDLKIQGGFALEIIYSLNRESISRVNHLPFENVRAEQVNEADKVTHYYYSKDWSNTRKVEPERICAFDYQKRHTEPVQILYVTPFSPGSFYYPKPDYIGSVNYIELDKEVGKYHINNIKNGMAPSFSIHFKNGVPPPEERNRIRQDMENQLQGATNAGKFIITYSDEPDRKPDFEPFPLSDADKQYQFLSQEVTAKIMVGHRVTSPMLFGVAVPGQLGGGKELEDAERIFGKNVIEPYRRVVLEAVKVIADASGLTGVNGLESTEQTQLSKEPEVPKLCEHTGTAILDFLLPKGEDAMGEEWELVTEAPVDYDTDHLAHVAFKFAQRVPGDAGRPSELDNDIVRIRYRYDGDVKPNSRDFCKMMLKGGRSKLYRKEDIIAAGDIAVNPGFGPNGSDTYSIWLWKGGAYCHHRWMRQVYLRKGNKKISVAEARRIISQIPDEDVRRRNKIKSEDSMVSRRPIDTASRGKLN